MDWKIPLISGLVGFILGSSYAWWRTKNETAKVAKIIAKMQARVLEIFEQKLQQRINEKK